MIEDIDRIIMKVEKTETYPNGFNDSIRVMKTVTIKANVIKIFLEWHNFSILCEQKAKSRKSIEKRTPPMKVAMEAK